MTRYVVLLGLLCVQVRASWDFGKDLNEAIREKTVGRLQLVVDLRSRIEDRPGQSFGLEPDLFADFAHLRFGLRYKPVPWIRLNGVARDTRAPLYGSPTPTSARDPLDLHEASIELRPDAKSGFGAVAGRQYANFGDTRLIGSPQWAYIARSYDGARAFWQLPRVRLEALVLAPVKPVSGFNKPVMGDRVEGTYNSVAVAKHLTAELYFLRHYQNRAGGFNGIGSYTTNSFGTHVFGDAGPYHYRTEIVKQTGKIGALPHRAHGWLTQLGRRARIAGHSVDFTTEYKYASGTGRFDQSNTFDQLYPAAHDKLGHADILGWRNVRNIRSWATWIPRPALAVTLMYDNSWLADARDAAYNAQGRAIARSASGAAGTHIGQEVDVLFTYKRSGFTLGGGYGHFFTGEFIRLTTPGASPRLAYIFQSYSF